MKILIGLILGCYLSSFAQGLTPKEKAVFDNVVYSRRQVGEYAVILKWVVPIRYKIYGDSIAYISKEIDTTFSQLKKLTQLDILKTNDDDEANFIIVIGKDEKYQRLLSKGSEKYRNSFGSFLYKSNKKSEIYRAENLLMPEKYSSQADVRHTLKKCIIKSFGFFKPTEIAPSSLFYSENNNKLKIDLFDSHIISTLYLPSIKPGMDQRQVDEILSKN